MIDEGVPARADTGWILLGAALLLAVTLYHFGYSAQHARAYGVADFPIFLRQAASFLETGVLYPFTDDLRAYSPAAPIYKFPPLYAMFLLPLVRHGIHPQVYFHHWLLQLAVYLAAVALTVRLFREPKPGGFVLLVWIVALNFEPFFETLWRLQIETPLLLLLLVCLYCLTRGFDIPAGMALGFCAMLKVYPALLLVYLLIKRRWIAVFWCLATAALILVAGLVVIGPRENYTYFFKILPSMMREAPVVHPENLGLGVYAQTLLGASPAVSKGIVQAATLVLLAVSCLVVRRKASRAGGPDRTTIEFSLFVALMLLALPNAWGNYQLLLLLPVVALLHLGLRPTGRQPFVLAPAILAYVFMLFYLPCESTASFTYSWPCAQTPYLLGLARLPRGLHDFFVDLRGLVAPLLWGATLVALWRDGTARPGAGDTTQALPAEGRTRIGSPLTNGPTDRARSG